MIDLHIHSNYSDGTDTIKEILEKAEKLNLDYISITDHDNCKAYKELKDLKIRNIYSGKIISGIEIKVAYKKRLIEVLGYNIDAEKMQNWVDEYYKDKTKEKIQQKYFDILYNKCINLDLKIDKKDEIMFDPNKDWASVTIYKQIIKYKEENKEKLPKDIFDNFNVFSKKYCADINGYWYIDKSEDYPSMEEAIKIIKQCGGLVFLPHLYIYKWAEDKEKFINNLLEEYNIDGIECMHSEFNQDNIKYLLELTKKRGYFRSGGSDYHAKNKPDIQMEIGKGNLNIPDEFVKEWFDKIKSV